jgi:DNA-binding transcriptional MerR regulator
MVYNTLMRYRVQELAKAAGISVRTLHYYDQIGLLEPAYIAENGYRYYEDSQVIRLQQILFFRELDFPLDKIKHIMQSPDFDATAALQDQRGLLDLKKRRLERLMRTIDKTMFTLKGGETMSNDDTFSAFNDPAYQKHKDEVQQRWGDTDAYKQSKVRVGKMSKADLERVKAEGEDIANSIAGLLKKGCIADSAEVQEQIGRFYTHLHAFYDPSFEMFKGLGQMYVDDPRFTEYYEKRAKGLAVFMRDAMAVYADKHLK